MTFGSGDTRHTVFEDISFDVPEGGLTMLLGRNGAGKTTTLRTIMGMWRAVAGEIRFAGRDISKLATPDIARLGIGYVPESMAVFSDLTVKENLILAARDGATIVLPRSRFFADPWRVVLDGLSAFAGRTLEVETLSCNE